MESGKHYVYILECGDNTYYTGYAQDVKKRMRMHEEGKGAKYTKGRGPFAVVYEESFDSKGTALKREYEIKQLSRKQKEVLIKYGGNDKGANTAELS
ncbi:GIY-YIG nuclease family protein [Evansella sp. LMS18]|jgi:putative endonuclease|uniref:GIY-YIG nuclease family protein n=1 Tax=Evansella sp. LMS18 TaxID=2924033 RepID=UPI0020D02F0E|nr:GIY-YIG nuclease family protein [Evansella sp. LMS18]UTR12428.1 GIY-YIG nuclease family protein [Evansella sp. LMS18]